MKLDAKLLDSTKGFLDREEGERLYEIALKASEIGPCLEIGSYCGKSTLYLGLACKEVNNILFAIDHHQGSEEQQPGEEYFDSGLFDFTTWRINTFGMLGQTIEQAGLEETVVPIVAKSIVAARAWATPLGLVFIDGGHSYEAALTDYNSWAHHITPRGYLLIHDIFKNHEQGGQAPYEIYKIAIESGFFVELSMTKTLGVLKRL